ncbi:TIGR02444 family protein [Alteromonas sp. 1_MG-2023]|uniref:TIGR02444 family protein n=1 Tax=Alteromonas sp. 1_MG-2023 TaxID=3062669 RepID=UPI0026E2643F|nr:TIGR02444 family protein [Alteromonas sp. 1_MG-2023]MDO6566862.1 TIGR02444 family protein [Alteromonas sp. 1_MG-2023]
MKHNNSILNATDFWQYTGSRYSKGDIAPLAILLQDQHGVNVNVLLFVCWCIEHGFIINLPQLKTVIDATETSEVMLKQHRQARKRAKPDEKNDADYEHALAKYKQLKDDELILEKAQQVVIVDTVGSLNVASMPAGASDMSGVFNASVAALINAYGLRDKKEARGLISQLLKQLS